MSWVQPAVSQCGEVCLSPGPAVVTPYLPQPRCWGTAELLSCSAPKHLWPFELSSPKQWGSEVLAPSLLSVQEMNGADRQESQSWMNPLGEKLM